MNESSSHPDRAGRSAPPPEASIDRLIQWVEQRRRNHPGVPLNELLDSSSLSIGDLVELAAIDLIARRRAGTDCQVEDYLMAFPKLSESDQHLLDLVDAELCVRREMDDHRDEDFYTARFPSVADAIRQLIRLECHADGATAQFPVPLDAATTEPTVGDVARRDRKASVRSQPSESSDFELDRDRTMAGRNRPAVTQESIPDAGTVEVDLPIDPPKWIAGVRCLSTSVGPAGRHWLVTGRDRECGETVAIKIIPLPSDLNRSQRIQILDLCELISGVTHPSWLIPRMATINNHHLALIRPWVHGLPYGQHGAAKSDSDRLSMLVNVAYALTAAHRTGATHGNVAAANLVVDHHGKLLLVDAGSSVSGWGDWLGLWRDDLARTLPARIRIDTRDLFGLVAKECFALPDRSLWHRLTEASESIHPETPEACAELGEMLQSALDESRAGGDRARRRWWRS